MFLYVYYFIITILIGVIEMINKRKLKSYGLLTGREDSYGDIVRNNTCYNTFSRTGTIDEDRTIAMEELFDNVPYNTINPSKMFGFKKDGKPAILYETKNGEILSATVDDVPKEATFEDFELADKQISKRGIVPYIGDALTLANGLLLEVDGAIGLLYGLAYTANGLMTSSVYNTALGIGGIVLGGIATFLGIAISDYGEGAVRSGELSYSYRELKNDLNDLVSKGKRQKGLTE